MKIWAPTCSARFESGHGRAPGSIMVAISQGRDTGLNYYQTQVEVTDPNQIVLID